MSKESNALIPISGAGWRLSGTNPEERGVIEGVESTGGLRRRTRWTIGLDAVAAHSYSYNTVNDRGSPRMGLLFAAGSETIGLGTDEHGARTWWPA